MVDLIRSGYRLARPVLFGVGNGDAEAAHQWTMKRLERVDRRAVMRSATASLIGSTNDPVTVFGVQFPNRVGLAAGMAKNGEALRAWPALGFGHVEIGTVTWHAQPGNERPRLFRLRSSQALINRMGFNNSGAEALAAHLRQYGESAGAVREAIGYPLGISLGKSKVTPLMDAVGDYVNSLLALKPYASYFAVNVSSPNTPGLRTLQDKGFLTELVTALQHDAGGIPLLVKVAPDLTTSAIDDVLGVCRAHDIAGIIATNTTTERTGIAANDQALAQEQGGLSGRPLTRVSRERVAYVKNQVGDDLPIIGVGGISSASDAEQMVEAGASLVQLYSALIYQGPALVRDIARRLARPEATS